MRAVVLREAESLGISTEVAELDPDCMAHADEAFLTNVRYGVRSITTVDGRPLAIGALSQRLRERIEGLDA
jgi:branched-subunit amino acid aminotransferase/4-amino-4-deoxychorismate lyase